MKDKHKYTLNYEKTVLALEGTTVDGKKKILFNKRIRSPPYCIGDSLVYLLNCRLCLSIQAFI